MLKAIESLREGDERFRHMAGGYDERGNPRPMEIEDLYALVLPLEFGPSVPEEIRQQFDNARHAFIYSWFAYEMATLAESHCYSVLERALAIRTDMEGRTHRRGLRVIIYEIREPEWSSRLRQSVTDYLRNAMKEPGKSIPHPFRKLAEEAENAASRPGRR